MKAYCVKCNRNKAKGEWTTCIVENITVSIISTCKGTRHLMYGTCPTCKSRLTKLISKGDYVQCQQ